MRRPFRAGRLLVDRDRARRSPLWGGGGGGDRPRRARAFGRVSSGGTTALTTIAPARREAAAPPPERSFPVTSVARGSQRPLTRPTSDRVEALAAALTKRRASPTRTSTAGARSNQRAATPAAGTGSTSTPAVGVARPRRMSLAHRAAGRAPSTSDASPCGAAERRLGGSTIAAVGERSRRNAALPERGSGRSDSPRDRRATDPGRPCCVTRARPPSGMGAALRRHVRRTRFIARPRSTPARRPAAAAPSAAPERAGSKRGQPRDQFAGRARSRPTPRRARAPHAERRPRGHEGAGARRPAKEDAATEPTVLTREDARPRGITFRRCGSAASPERALGADSTSAGEHAGSPRRKAPKRAPDGRSCGRAGTDRAPR